MKSVLALGLVAAASALSMRLRVGTNAYNYGNPATGCKSGEMNVSVTGVSGDFCSPPCDSSGNCPTDYPPGSSAQGECVLETGGSSTPTYCALICNPSSSTNQCGKGATCQAISGVGLCTYS